MNRSGRATPDTQAMLETAQRVIPGLIVRKIEIFADGMENHVLSVNDEWILRWREGPGNNPLITENALLRMLAGITILPIPQPIDTGAQDGLAIYRKLPGGPMPFGLRGESRRRAAHALARFLVELHGGVSPQAAQNVGIPVASVLTDAVVGRALTMVEDDRDRQLIRHASAIERLINQSGDDRVFLHNDLHHFNVCWASAEERLTGVIDFGDARVGDLHRDFAALCEIEPALGARVVARYVSLSGRPLSRERIVAYTTVRTVFDMVEYQGHDEARYEKTRKGLRALAAANPNLLGRYRQAVLAECSGRQL